MFEVLFGTEEQWEAFRSLPVVRAALDAVPDPVNGLLIYRGRGGGAGAREPRRPKPAPSSGAVSLPGPSDEPYLDLAADSAPAAADARPVTAAALQRSPGTWRPGLAEMMLTDTVLVLRPPVCGKDELAATGRSVTGRDCLKRSQAPEPPYLHVLAADRIVVQGAPERRRFCAVVAYSRLGRLSASTRQPGSAVGLGMTAAQACCSGGIAWASRRSPLASSPRAVAPRPP